MDEEREEAVSSIVVIAKHQRSVTSFGFIMQAFTPSEGCILVIQAV
jgi:hypothetical protein